MTFDAKELVKRFNQCINSRDVTALADLMTPDHLFVDSAGGRQEGRDTLTKVWEGFFRSFPDYQNHFEVIEVRGYQVLVRGHSTCSFAPLQGPALWMARVENQLIAEWHVLEDTAENRQRLELSQ